MGYLLAIEARKNLYKLIDEVAASHEPTLIKGKRNTAVLLSSGDWEDIKETIMVASDKKLSDSLIKGKNTKYSDCSTKLS